MKNNHLYSSNFPENHKVHPIDIINLYHEERFDELDAVVICKDKNGNVTATFGQNIWPCHPFSRNRTKNTLDFSNFDSAPELQRELKLFTSGWLFGVNHKTKKTFRFSSIYSQASSIKKVYTFLMQQNQKSLSALSSASLRLKLNDYLQRQGYAQKTLARAFIAINGAIHYESWHNIPLGIKPIQSKKEALRLSDKDDQQFLVIPERLCNAIYGKAIALIEEALPNAELLALTEGALQDNYIEGKRALDLKVQQGYIVMV